MPITYITTEGGARLTTEGGSLLTTEAGVISVKPKVCYETDASDTWVSVGTHGPNLTGGVLNAAPIGAGLEPDDTAYALTAPGISLTGAVSLGFWRTIGVDAETAGDTLSDFTLDDGTKSIAIRLGENGDGTLRIIEGQSSEAPYVDVPFATGNKHIAAVISGGNIQFYFNGAAVGSPQTITVAATGGSVTAAGQPTLYTGKLYQPFAHDAAYSAADIAYIYNAGSGRAYADMEVAATVPDAPVLTLDSVGNGQITLSWTTPADGGSEITEYIVYLDSVQFQDGAESPLLIDNLPNGVLSGPWTVKAVNTIGASAASNAVSGTPVGAGTGNLFRRRVLRIGG